ncbi:MAG: amidohydrolase [Xanthobacteraceae bacterium]|nr:amidohydrolase [Xanthobacteraceae bacterium]
MASSGTRISRCARRIVLGLWLCSLQVLGAAAKDLDEEVRSVSSIVNDAYDYLHQNPELGKREFKAHAYIKAALQKLGYTQIVESKLAPTAVIAVLDTGRPGPVVALRAEMDARPLSEGSEPQHHVPRSQIDGVMHNCGHDFHAAMLLGTAAILARNPDKLAGKVVFVFQPAEETAGGADDIVKEGILTQLGVEKIFAQHVAGGVPVGAVSVSPGAALAGSSTFTLKLKGRGSHAAAPYEGDDLPLLATHFAQALSYFPARRLDIANRPVVVSIARIAAGGASNVLPAEAEIGGTIRAFEDIDREYDGGPALATMLKDMVDGMAKAHGVQYEWTLRAGAPPTVNNPRLFAEVTRPLALVWPGSLNTTPYRGMFAEDFAFYTKGFPALYFSLGIAKDGLGAVGVHRAEFTIHPEAAAYGVRLMTLLARIGTTGAANWP